MILRDALNVTCTSLLLIVFATAWCAADEVTWKPVVAAVLKIDDQPAKIWNVYTADQQGKRILVQLGRRFLMLDTREEAVWEIAEENLRRRGKELRWQDRRASPTSEAASRDKLLPSEDWRMRDAGRARRIRVRLTAEGRVIEVQLPLRPDLRSLY
jgi:hypothetical protein